jgi:protein SCO1/2
VFLGFTNCPDACPTAMAEIRLAMRRLGDRANRIDVAMITVDPERDAGASFAEFVRQFVADGRALRTDDRSELQSIVTAFGATAVTDHDHEGEVEVGHTDYTYLVDDTGTVVLTWTAEMTVDDIVNDLEVLLA